MPTKAKPPTTPPPDLDYRTIQEVALLSPSRHGQLGGCVQCKQPITSHFNPATGVFQGCTHATEGMVFVLVGVPGIAGSHPLRRASDRPEALSGDGASSAAPPVRRFGRARYIAKVAKGKKVDVGDSEHRAKVLAVLQDSKTGLLSRDIITKSGLPHGSVQQALSWLRNHELVDAEEDTP